MTSSRTRHPLSLPPPPQPTALATPPTSPEFSPIGFGLGSHKPQSSVQSRISPTKRILRRKKSGLGATARTKRSKEPVLEGKENQDDKILGSVSGSASSSRKKLAGEGRLVARLRSVRSVPMLSTKKENGAPEGAFSRTLRERRDSGKAMRNSISMGEREELAEETGRQAGRYGYGYGHGFKSDHSNEEHQLRRIPTSLSSASASSNNMLEFGQLPSSAELDGGFGSISSKGDRKDPTAWQYSSMSTGTASHFASISGSSSVSMGKARERSETVTTFGGATSGSGSPRSTTKTIRINLGEETTPRAWTGRRRSSEASESMGSVGFGRTPGTEGTVRAGALGVGTDREEVYRRSRDLQRAIGVDEQPDRPVQRVQDDEESIEEIRDTQEMQQRFLQRHSRDFAHLHNEALASVFQSERQSLGSAASVLAGPSDDQPSARTFDPRETEDERQRRIVEEARREGREKRRSWMLGKAGLAGGPMSPTTTTTTTTTTTMFYGPPPTHTRNMSSISSAMSSGLSSPRLGEMTPRAHARQTSLRGGIRPLSLVISQENARARESASNIVLGPPLVTSPVSVVLEEEEKSDTVGDLSRSDSSFSMSAGHEDEPYVSHARNWSGASARGHRRGSIHSSGSGSGSHGSVSRSVSIKSHRRTMSPAQQALPPHLRSFSASSVSMTNSSMSSLGAVIGGNSESSCSSGEHIGGPRVLSSDAYNFRMSVNAPAPRAESRMTNSTYAIGSFRTESRMTMRTLDQDSNGVPEDRESRIKRRRARAFLVAGLKLESKVARPDSGVTAEQDEDEGWPLSPSEGKKDRRAGVLVEETLEMNAMEVMSDATPVERKRYSVMRREKEDAPTLRRAGTPLFPFHTKELPDVQEPEQEFLTPSASPEITFSVVEDSGVVRSITPAETHVQLPRDESENSLQDPSVWRAQSGEMMRELFWLPGSQPSPAGMAAGAASNIEMPRTPGRAISRPSSPAAVIHTDSAGASPGRERKTSWSNAARGWLRSDTKADPEAQVEKGFGHGRGEDLTNTLTSAQTADPSTLAQEKKSWKRYLGGAKKKRRGSLPETFKQDGLSTPIMLQAPPAAHVRRSTEPSSPAFSVTSPPLLAFPTATTARDWSPLSAASFSPQTPECLTRSPGTRIVLACQTPRALGIGQGDILLPTPGTSQVRKASESGSPSRMDMTGELYGLGLGPVQPAGWKGKERATDQDGEALQRQAAALAATSPNRYNFGSLGRRPDVGIHAKSSAASFGGLVQPPASAAIRPSSPTYSISSASDTEQDHVSKPRARPQEYAVDVASMPAYHHRSILLKHERRILPAKIFFMLGFLLGPWVWLFGGWALSPAGQFLPTTHIPLGLGHRRDARFSPQTAPEFKSRSVLPPMNRDRPEKWVKRNRIAAAVSSAVFIPAMCVGFGYLGKLL